MNQSAIKAQRPQGDNNNQSNDTVIDRPSHSPICFGAASIFNNDTIFCGACQYFEKCDIACILTLEKLKGKVDVSHLLKRKDADRMTIGLSVSATVSPATPATAQTEQLTVIDCELVLNTLLAEIDAQIESLAIPKLSEPPVTNKVAQCNSADLGVVEPMLEAKDVIAKAMDTSNSNSVNAIRTAAEPIEIVDVIKPIISCEPVEPTAVDPLLHLQALVAELRVHKNYALIRHEFVQLSSILNEQRLLAPAFRPQPKVGLTKGHPIFMVIHRDQIAIDCHWLYCRREHVVTRDEELQPLFDLEEAFSFEHAVEFAEKNWTKRHRIGQLLVLTPRQQCQLSTLKGKSVEARFLAALTGSGKGPSRVHPKVTAVRLKPYEWAERNKGVLRLLKDYENLWLARELLGNAAPIRQVAELFSLICGKPKLDDKTVKVKLETLNKHVGGTKSGATGGY